MAPARSSLWHPTRLVVAAFAVAAGVGTGLLMTPWATVPGRETAWHEALFTALSAVSVTGLVVVDTGQHWSAFGEVVILALIQLGGFGITAFASLLGVLVFRRLGLRTRLMAQAEHGEFELGSVRSLLVRIAVFFGVAQAVGFVLLAASYQVGEQASTRDAAWFGLFHSVSAFNNAGFSTLPESLEGLSANVAVLGVVGMLVIVGGIGFPVVLDLWRQARRPRQWSLHTKVTLTATGVLLVVGAAAVLALEWGNPDTLGTMATHERVANGSFASVMPRTAGFNTIDYSVVREPTLLVTTVLMFIGGGSASAAGGIKVGTFALLGFVIWSEMRGESDVSVFGRRITERTQRQALTVALVGVGLAVVGTLTLTTLGDGLLGHSAFEAVSALGTVGLSTGITADFSVPGRLALVVLMFLGRLGPVTVGTALVLRHRDRLYRYPEGRPLIG